MAEPIVVACCDARRNEDVGSVIRVPGAWLVVLHPLCRIYRTKGCRHAFDAAAIRRGKQDMRFSTLTVILIFALAACKDKAPINAIPPAPAKATPLLSAQGYGPVLFGAKLDATEQLLGEQSKPLGANDPACSSVRFDKLNGVRFMVENGVITRADADAGTPNELGLAVGETLEQARKKHPEIVIGPHKYVPEGHYLTVRGTDAKSAIVMEEDGKRITRIRAGLEPAVSYVEGCL